MSTSSGIARKANQLSTWIQLGKIRGSTRYPLNPVQEPVAPVCAHYTGRIQQRGGVAGDPYGITNTRPCGATEKIGAKACIPCKG